MSRMGRWPGLAVLATLQALVVLTAPGASRGAGEPGWSGMVDVRLEGVHVRSAALYRRTGNSIRPVEMLCNRIVNMEASVGNCQRVRLGAAVTGIPATPDAPPSVLPPTPNAAVLWFDVVTVSERLVGQAVIRLGAVRFECPDRPPEEVSDLIYYLYEPSVLDAVGALKVYKTRLERMVFFSDKIWKSRSFAFTLPPLFDRNAGPLPRTVLGKISFDFRRVDDLVKVDRAAMLARCAAP